jgi:hypothetical protein
MDNQHRKIRGYRDLSEDEIDAINQIKGMGSRVDVLIETLTATGVDQRWIAIAKTQLQQGFMALTRAVAKPEGF